MFGRKIHLNETIVGYISRSQYYKNRNLINHHFLKRCQICSKTLTDIIFLLYRASYDQYSPSRYHVSVLHLQYEIKCMCIFFEVIEWLERTTCYSSMLFAICQKVQSFSEEKWSSREKLCFLYISIKKLIYSIFEIWHLYMKRKISNTREKLLKLGRSIFQNIIVSHLKKMVYHFTTNPLVYINTVFGYKIQDELYSGKNIRANKSHHIYFLWLRK